MHKMVYRNALNLGYLTNISLNKNDLCEGNQHRKGNSLREVCQRRSNRQAENCDATTRKSNESHCPAAAERNPAEDDESEGLRSE